MNYVLDSDAIIYFLQGQNALVNKIGSIDIDKIHTTAINEAELYFGAYNSSQVKGNIETVRGFIRNIKVLDFDSSAAKRYGEIKSELKKQGKIVPDMDICIASITKSKKMTLVTNNIKDFARIEGLKVENWIKTS